MIAGVAAICGGITAAILLQYYTPFLCFFIYGLFGLVIAVSSLFIPLHLEWDEDIPED
jgi:hypothetical protein